MVPEVTIDSTQSRWLSTKQLAERAGLKHSTIRTYRTRGIAPQPDAMIGGTPGWTEATADAWIATLPKRALKGSEMHIYTVEIEAGNDDGTIWQAVHPAETVDTATWTRTGAEWEPSAVAEEVAAHQTVAEAGRFRVRVWPGADADTGSEPAATFISGY